MIRLCGKHRSLLTVFSVLVTLIGMAWGSKGLRWLPFNFDVAMSAVGFYSFGYFLSQDKRIEQIKTLRADFLFIAAIIWIFGIHYCSIELASRIYPMGIFSFVTAICGCLVVFRISEWIGNKTRILSRALSWCGRNSNQILCFHALDIISRNCLNMLFAFSKNIESSVVYMSVVRILISTLCTRIYLEIEWLMKKLRETLSAKYKY